MRDRTTYTLSVLGNEGFLPGYGVYEGGVTASARRGFARQSGPRAFDLSRNNVVALREFVPGNRLYANRGTFYVARYHLGADEAARIRTLRVDPAKGYVTEHAGDAAYGQSGGVPIDALPLTDLDLAHESRITEDENLRFSMPVSVLGRLRKRNRGGKALQDRRLRSEPPAGPGHRVGEPGRSRAGQDRASLATGFARSAVPPRRPYAVPTEIAQFLKIHKERCGKEPGRLALSVQAEVDMLQFHAVENEATGINIGEGLRTAATRLLDMGQEDLQLLLVQKPDDKLDLLIYDPMPGGSGLLEQMLSRWQELIATARELLAGCVQGCETACYACLKTFRNQFYHPHAQPAQGPRTDGRTGPRAAALPGHRAVVRGGAARRRHAVEQAGSPPRRPFCTNTISRQANAASRSSISGGLSTEPDWLHEPTKVAVYLDGMSRALHGDPKTAQRDQLIRGMLELDGYTVIVVQSRDLNDPQAVRQHLRNIAQAIGRTDLPVFTEATLAR